MEWETLAEPGGWCPSKRRVRRASSGTWWTSGHVRSPLWQNPWRTWRSLSEQHRHGQSKQPTLIERHRKQNGWWGQASTAGERISTKVEKEEQNKIRSLPSSDIGNRHSFRCWSACWCQPRFHRGSFDGICWPFRKFEMKLDWKK